MSTTLEAALSYIKSGVRPIDVPYKEKGPIRKGWRDAVITAENASEFFNGKPQNIGIILGAPSRGMVDVDLDACEALALAHWLPDTGRISGRPSNPDSHRWYWALDAETKQYEDVNGQMLVEFRSTGVQSLVPPSTHPSGEGYTWSRKEKPARVDKETLAAAVARVAAGALLVRHWPAKGSRHRASNALAGALLRGGWGEEEVAPFVEEVARVAGDEEWRERGKNVRTTARRLANEGRATGQPTLAQLLTDGDKVVEKLADWLGLRWSDGATIVMGDEPSAPATSPAPAWPAPPAAAAYHGLAGEIVRALEPHTEADPAALLLNTLVMFGAAAGRNPHALVGDDRHGANLFAGLVGETAKGRKGTSEGGPRRLVSIADLSFPARIMGGLSSGEGLIHAVRDAVTKEEPVKEKNTGRILGSETKVEDPGVEDKRLLVTEQELASTLRVMGRDGNTLSPTVRQAWDGRALRILVRKDPEVATDPHIAFIGHVTKDELLRYLDSTEAANGFANRFLWACVRRSKVLPEGGRLDDRAYADLAARLGDALAFARECGELRRDAEARALWAEVYPDLSEGKPGLFGAVTARAEAQVLRLSLVYALLALSPAITAEHLVAALAVWDYCEASARHIFGDATGDPIADRILAALRTTGPLAQNEVVDLFGRHVGGGRIDRALGTLVAARLAASAKEETGGRPRTIWRAL